MTSRATQAQVLLAILVVFLVISNTVGNFKIDLAYSFIDSMVAMKERHARGIATPQEARIVETTPNRNAEVIANIHMLHELGVSIVAGSDAGWRFTGFDDFYEELVYLAQAGLPPLEAIHAATGRAAEACQLAGVIGTVAPGCVADLIAVVGDPVADLGSLRAPAPVLQGGTVAIDRR